MRPVYGKKKKKGEAQTGFLKKEEAVDLQRGSQPWLRYDVVRLMDFTESTLVFMNVLKTYIRSVSQ